MKTRWLRGLPVLAAAVVLVLVRSAIGFQSQQRPAPGEFVKIQPGDFMMGCSANDSECNESEKPAHRVRITKAFEMGKYEVTQAQWEPVMGSNPSNFKGGDRPVEQVSWNDVQLFLQRLNRRNDGYRYRLPTEAQWEYAARAGTAGAYAGSLDAMAWYSKNSGSQTHPVGQKQPNAWGLYDMHGNVTEWVQDWYDANYYKSSPASDPQGPASGTTRVLRGGSWDYNTRVSRVSYRGYNGPSDRINYFGFRCVREAIP
jgi:formylglycine-generating enzyme required for sulfatase activity